MSTGSSTSPHRTQFCGSPIGRLTQRVLACVAPIPASSGQVQRKRLDRGGNRQLDRALHMVAVVHAVHHPPAKEYLAREAAEHKSDREAVRALKRQIVRTGFGLLREGADGLARVCDRSVGGRRKAASV